MKKKISYEYIRGLTDGEGTFTFHTTKRGCVKFKMPAFVIRMHYRDEMLLRSVRFSLPFVRAKIYKHKKYNYDSNSAPQVSLYVRYIADLKNVIIPLFYKKLNGHKRIQFNKWLEKMGDDDVVKNGKFLYRLYKFGYFDSKEQINKFI